MENNIYSFLKSRDFKLTDKDVSPYFGDYYDTFKNNVVELRFSSSRSLATVDICCIEETNNWYDLALVKALLYNEQELNKITTLEEYVFFLEQEIDFINELFNKDNYSNTKNKLEELRNKRAKQMFPGKVK